MNSLTGTGRIELVSTILSLREQLAKAERERDAYLANLTTTQARCTELLLEVRLLRAQLFDGESGR
jgi:hypothetical protein